MMTDLINAPHGPALGVRGVSEVPSDSKRSIVIFTVNTDSICDSPQHLERVVVADGVLDVMYSAKINLNGGYGRARRTTLHPVPHLRRVDVNVYC